MIPQTSNKGGDIDKCYTPPEAVRLILPFITGFNKVWESASGSGLIAHTLRKAGKIVYETDLESGQDFTTYEPDFDYDIIITNPPFNIDYKFVERATKLGKPWIMLMKDNRSSVKRFKDAFWVNRAKYQVPPDNFVKLIPSRRISFKMPKQGWFTFNKKTGKLENNSAQFATYWYMKDVIFSELNEVSVEYNQVDRLSLKNYLESVLFDLTEQQIETMIDLGIRSWNEY